MNLRILLRQWLVFCWDRSRDSCGIGKLNVRETKNKIKILVNWKYFDISKNSEKSSNSRRIFCNQNDFLSCLMMKNPWQNTLIKRILINFINQNKAKHRKRLGNENKTQDTAWNSNKNSGWMCVVRRNPMKTRITFVETFRDRSNIKSQI